MPRVALVKGPIQTRDRFGNAIEASYGDIFTGLLYGEQQVGSAERVKQVTLTAACGT